VQVELNTMGTNSGSAFWVGGFGGRTALPVNLDEFKWEKTETEVHGPHLGE
jgi:hypothetical protein